MTGQAYHVRVDHVAGVIPDLYRVTRGAADEWRNVRGLEGVAKAVRREAERFAKRNPGVPFVLRDSNGNLATLDPARGVFTYDSPCRKIPA